MRLIKGKEIDFAAEPASFVRCDRVLEIIDSYKYDLCWSMSEKLWNENLDKIKTKVLKLNEGELG